MQTNQGVRYAIVPEPLKGDNYMTWSRCLRNYLKGQDLWDVIQGTAESKPGEDEGYFKTWQKKNAMALHAIQMTCSSDILARIISNDSARAAWGFLEQTCGQQPQLQPQQQLQPQSQGAQSQKQAQTQPQSELPQPQPQTLQPRPQSQEQVQIQSQSDAQKQLPEPQPKLQPRLQSQEQKQTQPQSQESQPQTKEQMQMQPQSQEQAQVQPKSRPQPQSQEQMQIQPQSQQEQPRTKEQVLIQSQSEAPPQDQAEPEWQEKAPVQPKSQPQPQSREEIQIQQPRPQSEGQAQVQPQSQPQPPQDSQDLQSQKEHHLQPQPQGQQVLQGPQPQGQASSAVQPGMQENMNIHFVKLHKAVDRGDWKTAKEVLDLHPHLVGMKISHPGKTPLHLAVTAGHVEIVEELVKSLSEQDLAVQEVDGYTALAIAARGGTTQIAEIMTKKNKNLVRIRTKYNEIPVVLSSATGHTNMTRYLYSLTPLEDLTPEQGNTNGTTLLTNCIAADILDVALDLLQRCPRLAFGWDSEERSGVYVLARTTTSFFSGDHLLFWERFIYPCIPIQSSYAQSNLQINIQIPGGSQDDHRNIVVQSIGKLFGEFWRITKILVPGVKHIEERKLIHAQALELLNKLCKEISVLDWSEFSKSGISQALFRAVEYGLIEFVIEVFKSYPDLIWFFDEHGRYPFNYAVLQRQENIFNLMYEMGTKKYIIVGYRDAFGNNMLHHAAMLAPSSQLGRKSGGALQMQRELQWFKEVEKIVEPKFKEARNIEGRTPRDLFTVQHENLVKEGEKWMKDTATFGMVVATLIATIMFTAAFTVPGGNDPNSGLPVFLGKEAGIVTPFMVFIISVAISLFSSTTSILIFLGILTTRYAEDDFLKSLPNKLIIALSTLFVSIATMMIAFGATLYMMLHERLDWIIIPIILLGSIPITLFALLQFPLLVEIALSTYGPSIFNKKRLPW